MNGHTMPGRPVHQDERTTAQLVSDLSEQLSRLIRDEMRSGALEMRDKGRRLGAGAGFFGAAGVLALYGGGVLIAALVMLVAMVLTPWIAALIVGVVLLAIAGAAALIGRSQTRRAVPPLPEQTMTSVREDIDSIKGRAHR